MANGTAQECAEFGQNLLTSMTEHGFVKLVDHNVPLPLWMDEVTMFDMLTFHGQLDEINLLCNFETEFPSASAAFNHSQPVRDTCRRIKEQCQITSIG